MPDWILNGVGIGAAMAVIAGVYLGDWKVVGWGVAVLAVGFFLMGPEGGDGEDTMDD